MSGYPSSRQIYSTHEQNDGNLPTIVEVARSAWVNRMQASALVMGLFVGAEAQLLPDLTIKGSVRAHRFLRVLAYSGIAINAGGVLSCMYILVHLSSLPIKYWRMSDKPKGEVATHLDEGEIFRTYGGPPHLGRLGKHVVYSLLVGALFMFMQVGMMAFLDEEDRIVPYVVLVFILFGILPVGAAHLRNILSN